MPRPEKTVLAVDAHGGDHALAVTYPAVCEALRADAAAEVVMVGLKDALEAAREAHGGGSVDRLHFHYADSVLPMDVRAVTALRKGAGSSLWEAIRLVAEGEADACVSGGSTGAMMALGVRLVGMLPGIERPVLMAYIPHATGFTAALDLGANLSVSERQLVQFAVMGSITAEKIDGIESPRVGLLNVGHEESKGHVTVQAAHAMLKEVPINYVGFIEGNDLYTGNVDVAVCDGFTGNLILKSSEGLARMTIAQLKAAFSSSASSRVGRLLAGRALKGMLARLDPSAHNGAPLLGLRGVVVKSHGHADAKAYTQAILEAAQAARKKLPNRIDSLIQQYNLEA
jgi:glycerol-3-phosphate acyltransferase PlsX